eukprot:PITA_11741
MNSLSLQINKAVAERRCRSIRICKDTFLSHNLFVDDVLIFAMLCRATWYCLNEILEKFQRASRLVINKNKSSLYHNESNMDTVHWIADLISINPVSIKEGFKYLGFNLKAKGNSKQDWQWLLERFYKKISGWESRFLSLAGRFILVQAVLSQLVVFWAHLYFLPATIIKKMSSLAANFLWGGKAFQNKIHLVKMDSISKPKKAGGWGLLDMRIFRRALLCKSLHRGIFGDGLWSKVINRKYLKGRSLEFWFRRNSMGTKKGSSIWLSFRKIQLFSLENLRWKLYSGSSILIGFDSIVNGLDSSFSPRLVSFFHAKGIFTWDRLIKSWSHSSLGCTSLGSSEKFAAYSSKEYASTFSAHSCSSSLLFPPQLWNVACPLKMILFSWLVFRNRNLTWEVLQKKSWHGPGRCAMCQNAAETNLHMFFQCASSLRIWYELSLSFGFPYLIFSSVQDGFKWWSEQSLSRRTLFIFVYWFLWK